jgi:HlyD family secretion protein
MNDNIEQVLGLDKKASGKIHPYLKYLIVILILTGVLAWWFWPGKNNNTFQYQTAEVQRGDLTVTVTATGILQPLNQVDVGTEISGTVQKVLVDFNDKVTAGQILARLDTEQLSAKLRQSQAALQLARAQAKENEATVLETRAKLRRAVDLEKKKLGTAEQVDTAQAAYARAVASLERAKAQITQAEAQLDADKTTLSKAEIRSPINGIVLQRQIEPGQTVAASLQTPILFTLAENLAQMELHVAVDEADVGMVRENQSAIFRVDAFQQRSFPAKISQVRFAPQTVEGVVTYETILSVNNEDLALRPGMTATAEIIVQQLENALLVPNTALRFKPPKKNARQKTNLLSQLFSRRRSSSSKEAGNEDKKAKQYSVWTLVDNQPVKIKVKIGATDGQMTQITSGEIEPGMQIIVDTIMIGK